MLHGYAYQLFLILNHGIIEHDDKKRMSYVVNPRGTVGDRTSKADPTWPPGVIDKEFPDWTFRLVKGPDGQYYRFKPADCNHEVYSEWLRYIVLNCCLKAYNGDPEPNLPYYPPILSVLRSNKTQVADLLELEARMQRLRCDPERKKKHLLEALQHVEELMPGKMGALSEIRERIEELKPLAEEKRIQRESKKPRKEQS